MFNKKKMTILGGNFLMVLALVSFTFSNAWAAPKTPLPRSLTIATLPQGTGNNTLGAAIAKVLTAELPVSATDRPSGGWSRLYPKVNSGAMDFAISGPPIPYYATNGLWSFKNKPLFNIRQLASCNPLLATWFAPKNSGIKTWGDIKGKRMAIAKSLSGGAFYADLKIILKYYGVDVEKDLTVLPITSPSAGVRALIERRVDVAHGMVATPIVQEAEMVFGGLNWLFETKEQVEAIKDEQLKAGIWPDKLTCYKGLPKMPETSCFANGAVAFIGHKDLPEEQAYLIVKTLWENIKDIQATHPSLRLWTREDGFVRSEADFAGIYHPGAIRFYKELGKWTAEAEKQNQWLIEEMEKTRKKFVE